MPASRSSCSCEITNLPLDLGAELLGAELLGLENLLAELLEVTRVHRGVGLTRGEVDFAIRGDTGPSGLGAEGVGAASWLGLVGRTLIPSIFSSFSREARTTETALALLNCILYSYYRLTTTF